MLSQVVMVVLLRILFSQAPAAAVAEVLEAQLLLARMEPMVLGMVVYLRVMGVMGVMVDRVIRQLVVREVLGVHKENHLAPVLQVVPVQNWAAGLAREVVAVVVEGVDKTLTVQMVGTLGTMAQVVEVEVVEVQIRLIPATIRAVYSNPVSRA